MDILADENIPAPTIARLRSDGWTVLAMTELGPGDDDTLVAQRAADPEILLLTQDRDFGELAIAKGLSITGVVLMELERLSLGLQIERISSFLQEHGQTLPGYFTVLEPTRIRRRNL